MPSSFNLIALVFVFAIPSCEAAALSLVNTSLAGPADQNCDPVKGEKACRVFGAPAPGTSGSWTVFVKAVLKGSPPPANAGSVAFGGRQTVLEDDSPFDDSYVISNHVDMQKEYDVYYATMQGTDYGEVIKVTNGTCGCPPPPTLKNVRLGKASCESPKKKVCDVSFDLEIAGSLEASVYAIVQKSDAAAPQNYSDIHAFKDKLPDPRVKVTSAESGTGITLTRNITNGQDGDYKIYIAGKTKGGWLSDITALPACECPSSPSPSPSLGSDTLSSPDEDPPLPFPTWAIVIIIVAVLLLCCLIVFLVMKKREKKKKKTEEAKPAEAGGVEMSA